MHELRQHTRIRSFLRGEIVHFRWCNPHRMHGSRSFGGWRAHSGSALDSASGSIRFAGAAAPAHGALLHRLAQWRRGGRALPERIAVPCAAGGGLAPAMSDRTVQSRVQGLEAEITQLKRQLAAMRAILERIDIERG